MQQNSTNDRGILQLSSNIHLLNQQLRSQVRATHQLGQGYSWKSDVKSQIMFHHLQHIHQLEIDTPTVMKNFEEQLKKLKQYHISHIQDFEGNKSKLQKINSQITAGQQELQRIQTNRKQLIQQYAKLEQQLLKREEQYFKTQINKIKSESIKRKNQDLRIDISLAYGNKNDIETLAKNPEVHINEQFKYLTNYFINKLQEQQRAYHEALTKDKILKIENKNSERIKLQAQQLAEEIVELQGKNLKSIQQFEQLSKEKSQLMKKLNVTVEEQVEKYINACTYNKKKQLNRWKNAYEKAIKAARETVGQIQDVEGVEAMINLYINS